MKQQQDTNKKYARILI